MSSYFPRADAADYETINRGYENKNNFSNLPFIEPTPRRTPIRPLTPPKDTISPPLVILPIKKKKKKKRSHFLRPSRTIEKSSSPGKNNPLKISFSKFHVTVPRRSGYNKMYEIRRSRSFFFELDDHPQNTNDIHLKIHTNDYHMDTKLISYNNTSTIPNAKYQMSCMLTHFFSLQRVIPRRIQQKYFNYIRDKLLARHMMVYSRDHSNSERNRVTRTFFNFTYKRYRFHFGIYTPCQQSFTHPGFSSTPHICNTPVPFVMSKHRRALGVSYEESIHARDVKSVLEYGNKHMYRKRLTNFQLKQSNYLKVKEKQETRFLRACRRYNHGLVSDEYGFSTPHYYKITNYAELGVEDRPISRGYRRLFSAEPHSIVPWVPTYDPFPDMFIPYKYRDIIPKDPIYTDTGDYIVPGSRSWFTYMCNLHRRVSSANSIEERNDILQTSQERERHLKKSLQKERDLKIEAEFNGTSIHTLPRRKGTINMLTDDDRFKRNRYSEVPIDTTAVAGPSRIKI
ncbi:unnamed protein product [Rhizophagus irregularis]|nr:unnamed protein product [Rhizophagus irregularis]